MLQRPVLTLLGTLVGTAAAAGQQLEPTIPSDPVATPATSVAPSANTDRERTTVAEAPVLIQNEGEVTVLPIQFSDDSVPLPVAPVHDIVEGVDTVVTPASGDPYFLGFAGGHYYPPANEILDPALIEAALLPHPDARPTSDTYAFVMFSKRITEERIQTLKDEGCRVLGFHPHYTMRVAIPTDRIGEISTLDFVRWVGVARNEQKVHPATESEIQNAMPGDKAELYVSVFESDLNEASTQTPFGNAQSVDPDGTIAQNEDARSVEWQSNGWMHGALAELGAEIVNYIPRQNAFRIRIDPTRIEDLAARDFVQFVEPVPTAETNATLEPHDESTAMIMSEAVRGAVDGGTNEVAIVGVVDSGIEVSHADLGIWGVGWNCTTEASAWDDIANGGSGHGTHVTGTILGRGNVAVDHLGNAPGLASWGGTSRLFNYRRFPNPCSVGLDTITATFGGSYFDGTNTTERPHVVNNSWGSFFTSGTPAIGSELSCRIADDAVYDADQLWVWSSGNSGSGASTLSIESSAKNSYTVGNVIDYVTTIGDPGELWTSSSRGPAGDNRWKPNVVAPGRWIRSAVANNNNGLASYSGTSMASPHVTAAASILVDQYSFFRYQPARLQAHLMATAMTKDNASISSPSSSHLDTYGAGRVNVYKAMYNLGGNTWLNWGTSLSGSSWAFGNFTVPANCTRMVAVMTSLEESASAGASQALVNDYDFYLDQDPIDPAGNTGEWFAQQSTIDNSEIRILTNPIAGPWRWKVWPDSVTSGAKIGVTIYFIVDDTTPDGTLTVTASDDCVQPGDQVDVSATISSDDYVASAVVLDRSGSFATLHESSTTLADGVVTDLTDNPSGGNDIVLGDVSDLFNRTGTWTVSYASEGVKTFTVDSRSDNMVNKTSSVNITVDGTDPTLVSNLSSPSHTVNQWSNDPTIQWTWNAATDALSGLSGYGIFETTSASIPGTVQDIGAVTSYTSGAYPTSNSGRYFNIRSVDNCGNWDAQFASAGPYFIDTTAPARPATLTGTSHPVGSTRCDNDVTMRWSAGSDANSGVAGYSYVFSTSASTNPNLTIDTAGLLINQTLGNGTWYLHVRTIDVAGNGSSTSHFGPFRIVPDCGVNYCMANANSSGSAGRMRGIGSDDASDNNMTVEASQLPTFTLGYFLAAPMQGFVANPAGSQGNLCLAGNIGRYSNTVLNSGAAGRFQLNLDLTAVPTPTGSVAMSAGTTYQWQAWFRDANPNTTSNFTDGLSVLFY